MRGRLLLVFMLSLPLFLLLNMPVQQLHRVVTPPSGVTVVGLEGTLLSGRVDRLGYRGVDFRDLDYRLKPSCLLRLAVCYRVEDGDGDLSVVFGFSPIGGLEIEDSRLSLALERLRPLMSSLLVQPLGILEVTLETLQLSRDRRLVALDGQIFWREAGLEGEPQRLGDFEAVLERSEPGVRIRFSDLPGALVGVDGELRLGALDYRLDLKLQARDGLGESARNALGLLGRKTGLNRYRVQRQGRLPAPLPFLEDETPG
jgi:hypothetical protein